MSTMLTSRLLRLALGAAVALPLSAARQLHAVGRFACLHHHRR
ncbi:MAG: hypothetical protein R2712_04575 [Vicinamibacterales bacterium]